MNTADVTAAAVHALDSLAAHARQAPTNAAAVLDSVHATYGTPSLISALVDVLESVSVTLDDADIDPRTLENLHHYLDEAISQISGAGHDWIDRARQEITDPAHLRERRINPDEAKGGRPS